MKMVQILQLANHQELLIMEKFIPLLLLIFLTKTFTAMSQTTDTKTKFTLAPLPYGYDSLAPEISEETLRYHHDKHAAGYVAKLNDLVTGTPYESMSLPEIIIKSEGAIYNNAAQTWNHEFYFGALSPDARHMPEGALGEAIDRQFGSFERFKEQMTAAATGLFGSGYAWLVEDKDGQLSILTTPDAENPMCRGYRPLLCIDVWEHAYYLDYHNLRADAVKAIWNRIDWKTVGERYKR